MDSNAKKTALRAIPYGLYVLAAETKAGQVTAATVNWVTQASFEPPLVAVGVKRDSGGHDIIREAGAFSLSVLGEGQQGAPILEAAIAALECELVTTIEEGDHSLFLGKVVEAAVQSEISGRPDDATLALKDLGEKTFYGG